MDLDSSDGPHQTELVRTNFLVGMPKAAQKAVVADLIARVVKDLGRENRLDDWAKRGLADAVSAHHEEYYSAALNRVAWALTPMAVRPSDDRIDEAVKKLTRRELLAQLEDGRSQRPPSRLMR